VRVVRDRSREPGVGSSISAAATASRRARGRAAQVSAGRAGGAAAG
jgi:hypothetical protein